MARARTILVVVAALLVGLSAVPHSLAKDVKFQVIVHPSNPIATIEREFLHDAFLDKGVRWPNGRPVQPIMLPRSSSTSSIFVRDIFNRTPTAFRTYWVQRIFSGTGVAPFEAGSVLSAIAHVRANPAALSYLPPNEDPRGAKVVSLR